MSHPKQKKPIQTKRGASRRSGDELANTSAGFSPAPPKTDTRMSVQYISQAILSRFTPIRYLTPELLALQLDNFTIGWVAMAALSWEAIEKRDDVIKGVAAKRKKSVSKLKRESITLENSEEARAHAQALDEFYENMTVVNALDENERGGQSLLFRQMMDAMGKYYAVHEIVWQPGDVLTAELRFAPLWFFENRTGRLRFLPFVGSGEGEELEPGGWMITKGDGLMEACCVAWMFKHLPLKDWLVYSEKFGIPPVVGRTSGSPESEAGKGMARAVAAFGNEFASVVYGDDGSGKIEVMEVGKNSGSLPFPGLIERMDRAMCALWRGSDLSTMSADTKGASVQADESDLLLRDDADLISETLNIYIDRYVIFQKFGTDKPLARSQLIVPQRGDEIDLKIDEFLLNAGARLGERERLEHYGRPMIEETDMPLHAPAKVSERADEQTKGGGNAVQTLANEWENIRTCCHFFANDDPKMGLLRFFANAGAHAEGPAQPLIRNAWKMIREASAADMKPLAQRIDKLLKTSDAEFANAFAELLADREKLANQILKEPQAAKAFAAALGSALVSGLAANSTKS